MPAVARKGGVDKADTIHVAIGDVNESDTITCDKDPTTTATAAGSSTVFAEGTGVVRVGDAVAVHTYAGVGCPTHSPGLSVGSPNVFVEGKAMGRKDDTYGCGAQITSGASTVFANGN